MSKPFSYFCSRNFSFFIATLRTAFSPCRLIILFRMKLNKISQSGKDWQGSSSTLGSTQDLSKTKPYAWKYCPNTSQTWAARFHNQWLGWTDWGTSDAPHMPCPLVTPLFIIFTALLWVLFSSFTSSWYHGIQTAHSVLTEDAQCRTEWNNPFPSPSGCSGPDAPQDVAGSFGCQGKLLTRIQLGLNHSLQVPFSRAALQPLNPHSVHLSGVALSQVHNLAFAVEFHVIGDCPALQCFTLSLQGLLTLEEVNSPS